MNKSFWYKIKCFVRNRFYPENARFIAMAENIAPYYIRIFKHLEKDLHN